MYRPGELDKLINILREVRVDDGLGGETVTTEVVVEDLWAHARPRSAKETEGFDRLNASAVYLFVIRYRDDILPTDRIEWEGVQYNIRGILTRGGRDLYLELEAERGVAQ